METKQYLGQIKRLDVKIENKLAEIHQLRTMAESITAPIDKERVSSSGDKDKIGCIMARVYDMECQIDEMVDKRFEIVTQIESMEDVSMYDILAKIYILGGDLKVIAIEKGVTYRHIFRLHDKAVKEFEKKYSKFIKMS